MKQTISLEERIQIYNNHLKTMRSKLKVSAEDQQGDVTSSISHCLRSIAVYKYLLYQSISNFQEELMKSVKLYDELAKRFEKGEPISIDYLSILHYQKVYDALASGNFQLALTYSHKLGKQDEYDRKNLHALDYALGHTLKAFVEKNKEQMQLWSSKFTEMCETRKYAKNFNGYAEIFAAILEHDLGKAEKGFKHLLEGHKRMSIRGIFSDVVNANLSIWGIGMANLARYHGLKVMIDDPLIPADLLCEDVKTT